MHLFKNTDGAIYAYSDEDFINLAIQKYPRQEIKEIIVENDYTDEELLIIGKQSYPDQDLTDEEYIALARQDNPINTIYTNNTIEIINDYSNSELWEKGRGIIIDDYGYTPFSYTDEEIAAQEQERLKQQQIAEAHSLLSRSIKLESGVYQRRMSAEQQAEFVLWQDLLLEFIKNERQDLPPTPEFINQLLEEL